MIPTAEQQIEFLQKIQLLLEEGSFSSTYKFALLLALSDLSVEKGNIDGQSLSLTTNEIAEKFIQYYWRQSSPYPSYQGKNDILFQNSGKQASVVNSLISFQENSTPRFSHAVNNEKLVNKIAAIVSDMPLWRLQNFAHGLDEFLYLHASDNKSVCLRDGVAYCFRVFYGQIQDMIKGAWVRWVQQLKSNNQILGQHTELSDFMFGSQRSDLSVYVPLLQDIQSNKCFYCNKVLQSNSNAVDHFVPWSRYPVDMGHNFVLTHKSCNSDKSDMLPGLSHLEKWVERNDRSSSDLITYFNDKNIANDLNASIAIASWAYSRTELIGGDVWLSKKGNTEPLDNQWHSILSSK